MTYNLLPDNIYNFQFTGVFLKRHKGFQMTFSAKVIFRERSRTGGTFMVSALFRSFIMSLHNRKRDKNIHNIYVKDSLSIECV